jgi:hypothetical protein
LLLVLDVRRTNDMQIRTQVYCFVLFLAILLTSSLVRSQVGSETAAHSAPREEKANPTAFYAAVSQSFDVPANQVRALVDAGLPADEVAVVYFVAQNSLRSADEILADRESGKSWREIAMVSDIGPELFYYPLPQATRKPFTNVYAVYHELPRNRWTWDRLRLGDQDVQNLVNLRFLGELAGNRAPGAPVKIRGGAVDVLGNVEHFLLSGQQTASRATAQQAQRS